MVEDDDEKRYLNLINRINIQEDDEKKRETENIRNNNCRRNAKVYCGDKEVLPPNYDRFGGRQECLRKGYGTGYHSLKRSLTRELSRVGIFLSYEEDDNNPCYEPDPYIIRRDEDEYKYPVRNVYILKRRLI